MDSLNSIRAGRKSSDRKGSLRSGLAGLYHDPGDQETASTAEESWGEGPQEGKEEEQGVLAD